MHLRGKLIVNIIRQIVIILNINTPINSVHVVEYHANTHYVNVVPNTKTDTTKYSYNKYGKRSKLTN